MEAKALLQGVHGHHEGIGGKSTKVKAIQVMRKIPNRLLTLRTY
jgi:hypothetical protein